MMVRNREAVTWLISSGLLIIDVALAIFVGFGYFCIMAEIGLLFGTSLYLSPTVAKFAYGSDLYEKKYREKLTRIGRSSLVRYSFALINIVMIGITVLAFMNGNVRLLEYMLR